MDLTTKQGRQQAYADGGPIADMAALIEDALASDDRDRNTRTIEVLVELSDIADLSIREQQLLDLAINILRGKA